MPISRRHFLISSSAAVAAGMLLPRLPVLAQGTGGFRDLRRGTGIFTARGGTIGWLVNAEGLIVVDSQFPASAGTCLEGLKGKTEHPIDALINTHHHGDHTAGNGAFREAARAIVAHANVPDLQRQAAEQRGNLDGQTYADTLFDESWTIEVGDETISAHHLSAAHTGGDSVVFFHNANVVHLGDLVFNRWYPFIDRPGGASIAGWISFLEGVLSHHGKETLYVFGHGKPEFGVSGNHEDVALQRNYLEALLGATRKGLAAGKSAAEIAQAGSLPGFPDHVSVSDNLSLKANVAVAVEELSSPD